MEVYLLNLLYGSSSGLSQQPGSYINVTGSRFWLLLWVDLGALLTLKFHGHSLQLEVSVNSFPGEASTLASSAQDLNGSQWGPDLWSNWHKPIGSQFSSAASPGRSWKAREF